MQETPVGSAKVSVATSPTKQIKTDSWMEDMARSSTAGGKNSKKYSNLLEMERFSSNHISMDDSTIVDYNPVDDIPVLPDVDEIQEALLYNESANVPSVTTLNNLTSDIFPKGNLSALGSLDEIDISILTECLESEADIEEPDVVWSWDQLFTQLSRKITYESKTTPVEYTN